MQRRNLTFDLLHGSGPLQVWLRRTHRAGRSARSLGKPDWAALTLRQSTLIFLWRTVTFEAISNGVAHKGWHGGKINHSPDPRPLPPRTLCPLLSGPCGHQRAAKAHQRELENPPRSCSGVSPASVCAINSFQSGPSLTAPPPPSRAHTFFPPHCPSLHSPLFFRSTQ